MLHIGHNETLQQAKLFTGWTAVYGSTCMSYYASLIIKFDMFVCEYTFCR